MCAYARVMGVYVYVIVFSAHLRWTNGEGRGLARTVLVIRCVYIQYITHTQTLLAGLYVFFIQLVCRVLR